MCLVLENQEVEHGKRLLPLLHSPTTRLSCILSLQRAEHTTADAYMCTPVATPASTKQTLPPLVGTVIPIDLPHSVYYDVNRAGRSRVQVAGPRASILTCRLDSDHREYIAHLLHALSRAIVTLLGMLQASESVYSALKPPDL